MNNIKAIAFDLGGVLIKENDFVLSKKEQVLEKEFGNINSDKDYYEWATKTLQVSPQEFKKVVEYIIENIYELREPDIFDRLPKLKLAIASNHVSEMIKAIEKMGIKDKFDCILFSGNSGSEKPQKVFYEKLIAELGEKPENILFVDDSIKNIEGAKEVGLSTLHYDRSKSLTDSILAYLNKPIKLFKLPLGFVFDESNNILLLKRKDRQNWEPVKGGIEDGESPEQAIKREFFEETGIPVNDVAQFEYLGERTEMKELDQEILDAHRYVFFFKVKGSKPVVKINHIEVGGEDHDAYGWFSFECLSDLHIEYRDFLLEEIRGILKS